MITKKGFSRSLDPKLGVFGVIGGQNLKISEPRQIIYQIEALAHVVTKKRFTRSIDPKLGVFGVIWGQNPKIFKPRQIIYQNEALGALITKKRFSRSPEVTRPQIGGYLWSFGVKSKNFSNLDK